MSIVETLTQTPRRGARVLVTGGGAGIGRGIAGGFDETGSGARLRRRSRRGEGFHTRRGPLRRPIGRARPGSEGGLVEPPLLVQTVFGILGAIGGHQEDVLHMKRTADHLFGDAYVWSVLGAGRNQMAIAAQAAAKGGDVRVGLEDALRIAPGRLAESNAQQVKRGREILADLSLETATPDEAREMLALKGGDQVKF